MAGILRGAACALLGCFCIPALAQSGGMRVAVVDPVGEPLPGAIVVLRNAQQLSAGATLLTDAKGRVEFPILRPGGGYSIEVTFPGYVPRTVSDLHVQLGESIDVPVPLHVSVEEQVEVRASREIVDIEETAQSSRFGEQFLSDLPVQGRQYQNVLKLAPGVLDPDEDGNPNVHGARARDFKTVVNGVSNVDPLTGYWMSNVNPDSIEELEVIPAGAGVEFGRAQGGFARVIQKQGSNDLEGVFNLLYASSVLDAKPDGGTLPDYTSVQPSLQISGPIARDRLWYRLSYEYIRREDPVDAVRSVAVATQEQTIQAYQLTWQASPRNKVAVQYQRDPKTLTNVNVSSTVPAEASQRLELGGPTTSLTWTAAQSPRLLIESNVAWQEGRSNVLPSQPGVVNDCVVNDLYPVLDRAQCYHIPSNTYSGSYNISSYDRRQRFTVGSHAESFAGRFWGGTHRFKFGFTAENERYYRTMEQRPTFNFDTFRSPFGRYGIGTFTVPFPALTSARVTGFNSGVYVEDQYRPASNLTLTLGVRLDREQLDSIAWSPLDPVGETLAYEAALAQGTFPAAQLFREFFTTHQDPSAYQAYMAQVLNVDFSQAPVNTLIRQSVSWVHRRQADDLHIRNSNFAPRFALAWDPGGDGKTKLSLSAGRYYDKIFLGVPLIEVEPATTTLRFFAHEEFVGNVGHFEIEDTEDLLGDGTPITVRVVDRTLTTPYQDELAAGFEREISPETAIRVTYIRRRFEDQLQDTDVNHAVLDFGTPRFYTLSPIYAQILVVGNYNTTRYEAYVLQLVRRLYRNWQMDGSYTWSKAEGAAEDFDQLLGNDPRRVQDEQGPLAYDQRHVVKVSATNYMPSGWRFGGTVQFESGLPYSTEAPGVIFGPFPPGYLGTSTAAATVVYPTGHRNDNHNDPYWTFDARVQREWMFRSVTYGMSADVFNLLDDTTTRILDVTGGTPNEVRRHGRRWQLGFRAAF